MARGIRLNLFGQTGCGKTVLKNKLIPFLKEQGYSVVEVDTYRTTEAGYRRYEKDYDIIISEYNERD